MYHAYKTDTAFGFIPVGWESRYVDGIPSGAITITDEQHADYFEKQSLGKQSGFDIVDGVWTYVEPEPPTTEELQKQK